MSTQSGKTIVINNTNKLLWSDDIAVGKTGYTKRARHCFVCAGERKKETIIVALLGAPSRDLLWKESENLLAFGSRVMNHQEKPVVYLTKSAYDSAEVRNASFSKKLRTKKSKNKRQDSL